MPAEVIDTPLAVRFSFPGGRGWSARLDGLPNPRLALDLAHGMVMCFHPYGRANATHTARRYVVALRSLVRALAEAGFTGPAGELTRPMLLRYWMSHAPAPEQATRAMLRGFDTATGALRPEVREHLAGRAIHAIPKSGSYQPYTDAEWARLTSCCQRDIQHGWTRHQAVLAGAGRAGDPRTAGVSRDSLAWLMLREGPLDIGEVKDHLRGHVSIYVRSDPAGRGRFDALVRAAREALFPTYGTQSAYRLLFGIYTGIVPDGIDGLGLGDIDWAGDHQILLDYVKGRTGPEGLTLPARAVRLLTRWLEHSAPLRRFAPPQLQDRVWIAAADPGGRSAAGSRVGAPADHYAVRRWADRHDLRGDDGARLAIHRSRIRTTYQNILARRGWTGRTTIDPNHTARVEGDNYLSTTTPAQRDALESIIEDGQADLMRRSLPRWCSPPTRPSRCRRLSRRGVPARPARGCGRRTGRGPPGRVHRRLRGSTRRRARPERAAVSGAAVGLSALPAGGVPAPARAEPVATQGLLRPPVPADAHRAVRARVRALRRPARPRDPAPAARGHPRPGRPAGPRRRHRAAPTPREATI